MLTEPRRNPTSNTQRIAVLVDQDLERGGTAWRFLRGPDGQPERDKAGTVLWVPNLDYADLRKRARYGLPPSWQGPLCLVTDWDRELLLWACDCAEAVLPIWEKWAVDNAPDHFAAPRQAIDVARRYAYGGATIEDLDALELISWVVAVDAARIAELDPSAWDAADAAWTAVAGCQKVARTRATGAAVKAARAVVEATWAVGYDATAGDAAGDAAEAAQERALALRCATLANLAGWWSLGEFLNNLEEGATNGS